MATTGPINHIDISVAYPEKSIPFYDALLRALGFERIASDVPGFAEPSPSRAGWAIRYADGAHFGIELRPSREESRVQRYDRYAPGLHHIAFHAGSEAIVDAVYDTMRRVGAEILDPPADYSGRAGYSDGYYAVFFADPDNVKLEVVYEPHANPG